MSETLTLMAGVSVAMWIEIDWDAGLGKISICAGIVLGSVALLTGSGASLTTQKSFLPRFREPVRPALVDHAKKCL